MLKLNSIKNQYVGNLTSFVSENEIAKLLNTSSTLSYFFKNFHLWHILIFVFGDPELKYDPVELKVLKSLKI